MTNVECSTSLVFVREPASTSEFGFAEPSPDGQSVDYLRARERAERAAAKVAQSIKARRLHQELAQHYARQIDLRGPPRER